MQRRGYRAPAWLEGGGPVGDISQTKIPVAALRAHLWTILWSPPGSKATEELPLLMVHDGPEYAAYSSLLLMLGRLIHERRLPRLRAALLAPVDRNETYSASPAYARALVRQVIPALRRVAPAPEGVAAPIGVGASLGALALLHAHRTHPTAFGGLFLQSGSYFRQRTDKQESSFGRFLRINRFVGKVLRDQQWLHPLSVTMTCGATEENLSNNRAVRDALVAQGYDVSLHENRAAHDWIGWRDTFDPHLVDLLNKMWP